MSLPKPYYDDGKGIVIYHGDCRDILPHLPKVDLVLTDPPYGIAHASNYTCETTTAQWMNTEIQHDGTTELRDFVLSQYDEWVCFASLKVELPICRGVLVWDKGPASGMGDLTFPWKTSYELICINGKGWNGSRDEGVIKNHWIVTRASMGRTHPNEKPESLIAYLLSKHPANTIIDHFMGSGTTLRAAKDLGRKCIGIEIEEKYCEIAARRLGQEVLDL